jgi:cytidylate kinase
VIAIDGPSGVGKSTVSRQLAARLGLAYVDSGALYRAAALKVLRSGVDPDDRAAVEKVLAQTRIEVEPSSVGGAGSVRLDGDPVGAELRDAAVTRTASRVAAQPAVRARLTAVQRAAVPAAGAVVEGRDIGSVVFPDTPHKFFLDARVEVRGRRRLREEQEKRPDVVLDEVVAAIGERDRRDTERTLSPLRLDASYQVIDTSDLDIERVVELIESAIGAKPARRSEKPERRTEMARRKNRDLERTYTRSQFVAKLRRLADSLERGKPFAIQVAGERLQVPTDAVFNVEHERSGGEDEIEFQLRWKTGS